MEQSTVVQEVLCGQGQGWMGDGCFQPCSSSSSLEVIIPSFLHSINVYIEHLLGARHSLTLLLANSMDCGQVANICGPRSPLFIFLSFVFFFLGLYSLN